MVKLEDSNNFKLTKQEDTLIRAFVRDYYKLIRSGAGSAMPSSVAWEDITKRVVDKFGDGAWYFGRALNTIGSNLSKSVEGGGDVYVKTMPDRSTLVFGSDELEDMLYRLGKFYFARSFCHGYESLRGTSYSWVQIDDYVNGRKGILEIEGLGERLPELDGIF